MNTKKLDEAIEYLKEQLGKGLLHTDIWMSADGQSIAEDTARINQVRAQLTRALAEDGDRKTVSRRTPRAKKSFSIPTETRMSVDEVKNYSVLEIATPGRPGLLARIGRVFNNFDVLLQAAKIQTLGERVEDVFFITESNHKPITDPQRCEALQQAIRDVLDEQATA